MRILVGCETSGRVREAMRALGHDAWSCDHYPSEDHSPFHIIGDVEDIARTQRWDMLIVHPTCTFLCGSGLHWNDRGRGWWQTIAALQHVRRLLSLPIERICLENPVGLIGTRIRGATQYIQPYEFGHDASKRTGLWLKNLAPLVGTQRYPGRWVWWRGRLVERWGNQTDSGQNKLPPSEDRWRERSRTYEGIARAMADQWGGGHLI